METAMRAFISADMAGSPGIEREGARRTSVTGDRYVDAFEASVAMLRTGGSGTDEYYG